jgi:hypothetical protein
MTRILAVSLCCGRGATAGALLASGAVASGVVPTSGPAADAGGVSPEGVGGAAAAMDGVDAGGVVAPVISLSGIW